MTRVRPRCSDCRSFPEVREPATHDRLIVTFLPGQRMDLKAVVAPDGRAAAQVYPANYWLSLLEIPKGQHSAEEFALETKACFSCHQVGTRATREIPKGSLASMLDAWDRHTAMGPNGANMSNVFKGLGEQRKAFADWTDPHRRRRLSRSAAASRGCRAQPRHLDVGLGAADQPPQRRGCH